MLTNTAHADALSDRIARSENYQRPGQAARPRALGPSASETLRLLDTLEAVLLV